MTLLLALSLFASALLSQDETYLGQLVRKEGKSLEFVIRPAVEWQSIDKLVAKSDLIAFATVGTALGASITADGNDVRTDYRIQLKEIVFASDTETRAADSELTLSQLGGTAPVAGHTVTTKHVPLGPLEPGSNVLLLLRRVDEKYRIVNEYFGIFVVREGIATPASTNAFDQTYRSGKPLPDVLNEISAALAKRKK